MCRPRSVVRLGREQYNKIAEAGGLYPKFDPMAGAALDSRPKPNFEQKQDELPSFEVPGLNDLDVMADFDRQGVRPPSFGLDHGDTALVDTLMTYFDDLDGPNQFTTVVEVDAAWVDDGQHDDPAGAAGP